MTERDWRNFPILFGSGFALAAILSVAYDWTSHFLVGVAFGLLCFGCGVALMLCLYLWKRSKEVDELVEQELADTHKKHADFMKESEELRETWNNKYEELDKIKTKFEGDRAAWEAQKSENT